MTESQINYFLAVAKEKSISKASETLFVSQPAVSKQIALLETELGCKLFERHTRGLDLTTAGTAFEKLFLEFKIRLRETLEIAHAEEDSLSGRYVLGAFDGWRLSEFSLDLFEFLRRKYPRVEFEVMSYSIDQIIYALKHGEVDDIVATESVFSGSPELNVTHICSISPTLLFSADHPLAAKEAVTRKDIQNEKIFFLQVGSEEDLTPEINRQIGMQGIGKNPESVDSVETLIMLVRSNQGISILPQPIADQYQEGCVVRELIDMDDIIEFVLYWKTENVNPSLQLFLQTVYENYDLVVRN